MRALARSDADQRLAGAGFVVVGVAFAVVTIAADAWSDSILIGAIAGLVILALGIWLGVPRMKRERRTSRERLRSTTSSDERRPTLGGAVLAVASAAVAASLTVALAYLMHRLGQEMQLRFDLGVVCLLVGAAGLIYAGLLQWTAASDES